MLTKEQIQELKAEHRQKKKEMRRACLMAFARGFCSVVVKLGPWAAIAGLVGFMTAEEVK